MGVIQHVRLTPLIIQAETFETAEAPVAAAEAPAPAANMPAGHSHDHSNMAGNSDGAAASGEEHHHDANAWAPQDGLERSFYTTLRRCWPVQALPSCWRVSRLSLASPSPVRTALIWGICGFIAVSLAPAFSLPPELPGTAAAALGARQPGGWRPSSLPRLAIWLRRNERSLRALRAAAVADRPAPCHRRAAVRPHDTSLSRRLPPQFRGSSLGANFVTLAADRAFPCHRPQTRTRRPPS